MQRHGKPVRAVVEVGSNFVFHLLAVARIGFDSPYGDRYAGAVDTGALETLGSLRPRLSFGDGRLGDLVPLAVFLPSHLNLSSSGGFREYFHLLDRALDTGNPRGVADFVERYAPQLAATEAFVRPVDAGWLSTQSGARDGLRELAPVYVRSFDRWIPSLAGRG
ncbi:MAG: hypothetical protein K6U08_08215 [Firmicutes bacterium]|nr:hypothetical protein [Bacillota bacterium]